MPALVTALPDGRFVLVGPEGRLHILNENLAESGDLPGLLRLLGVKPEAGGGQPSLSKDLRLVTTGEGPPSIKDMALEKLNRHLMSIIRQWEDKYAPQDPGTWTLLEQIGEDVFDIGMVVAMILQPELGIAELGMREAAEALAEGAAEEGRSSAAVRAFMDRFKTSTFLRDSGQELSDFAALALPEGEPAALLDSERATQAAREGLEQTLEDDAELIRCRRMGNSECLPGSSRAAVAPEPQGPAGAVPAAPPAPDGARELVRTFPADLQGPQSSMARRGVEDIDRLVTNDPILRSFTENPCENCDNALLPGRQCLQVAGYETRTRSILLGLPGELPMNHQVIMAEKGGTAYVVDLTARQFKDELGFNHAIIDTEENWARLYRDAAERNNYIIKYKDDPSIHGAPEFNAMLPQRIEDTFDGATILYRPD